MSKEIVVDVASRAEKGKNVSRRLRSSGTIPAVLYGEKKPPMSLSVDPKAIQRILTSESGGNTLFQLRLDGQQDKRRHVMIREPQRDPVTGGLLHVDFLRIDTSKKVEVEVPITIEGVAEGVKNEGGMMDFVGRTVEVICLPTDIPEHLVVDVSEMHVGQVFRVGDLPEDERFEMRSDPEQPLVVISSSKAAEEEEAAAEAAEAAEAEEGAAEAPAGEEAAPGSTEEKE